MQYNEEGKKNVTGELTKTNSDCVVNYTVLSKGYGRLTDNNFNFNTAISAIMELVNAMYAHKDKAETINSALAK